MLSDNCIRWFTLAHDDDDIRYSDDDERHYNDEQDDEDGPTEEEERAEELAYGDDWGVRWTMRTPDDRRVVFSTSSPMEQVWSSPLQDGLDEAQLAFDPFGDKMSYEIVTEVARHAAGDPIVAYALARCLLASCWNPTVDKNSVALKALECFVSAARAGIPMAYRGAASSASLLDRDEEAIGFARRAFQLAPENGECAYELFERLINGDGTHQQEAFTAIGAAIRLKPEAIEFRTAEINFLRRIGQLDAALHAARSAQVLVHAENRRTLYLYSQCFYELGEVLSAIGRREEAIRAFRESIRRQSHGSHCWGRIAGEFLVMGRYAEAVANWERVILISPDYFDRRPAEREHWESSLTFVGPQAPADLLPKHPAS